MLQWLKFNMGLIQVESLTPLLPALQTPSTTVEAWGNTQLGLGWFITPASAGSPGSVWKDGGFEGTNTYIVFLPSDAPGSSPSQAGVFVLLNAGGITSDHTNDGPEVSAAIANDLLAIMQGQTPQADKSRYPRSVVWRRRARPSPTQR
jgi:serine-type D-Ala-D-Ala carboxypeptidase/endopeptidase